MSSPSSGCTSPCPLAKFEPDLDSDLEEVVEGPVDPLSAVGGTTAGEISSKGVDQIEEFEEDDSEIGMSRSSEGSSSTPPSAAGKAEVEAQTTADEKTASTADSGLKATLPCDSASNGTVSKTVTQTKSGQEANSGAGSVKCEATADEVQVELDPASVDDLSVSSCSGNNHRQNSTTSRSSNCSFASSSAVPPPLHSSLVEGPASVSASAPAVACVVPSLSAANLATFKSLTFPRDIPSAELALHYTAVPPSALTCIINLNVGGHAFTTSLSTLVKYEDSMLAAMFSGRHAFSKDREGRYFIDRDGQYFGYILSYLRSDALPPEDVVLQVLREAEFFCLQSMIEKLEASSPRVIAVRRREYFRALIPDYESIKKSIIGVASQKRTAFEESVVVLTQDNHSKLQGSIPCYNCTRQPVCVTHDCTFQGNKSDITIKVKTQEINMDKMIGFIVNELSHDGFAVQCNVVVCKFSLRCHGCTMSGLYTAGGILAPRECPNMAHVLTFSW